MGVGMAGFNLLAQGVGTVKGSIIGMNATLETSTLQFETLMGSADDAKTHVMDLFQFAKATPFETGPVIDASRMLRTFGGSALDTIGELTRLGDAAAATNAPINEVAFWTGRAYAAMQAGQPYGEATMRLQELAILSPQAAQKLQELQKAGASADQQFAAFSTDMDRFRGAMAKQAGTWAGLTSTFSDSLKIMSAKAFAPLFEAAKQALGGLIDFVSNDAVEQWATNAAAAISGFVGKAGEYIGRAIDFIRGFWLAFTVDKGGIGIVYDAIRKTFGEGIGDFVRPALQAFMDFVPVLQQVGRWVGYAFEDLFRGDPGPLSPT